VQMERLGPMYKAVRTACPSSHKPSLAPLRCHRLNRPECPICRCAVQRTLFSPLPVSFFPAGSGKPPSDEPPRFDPPIGIQQGILPYCMAEERPLSLVHLLGSDQ